jgi:hypothetical protein
VSSKGITITIDPIGIDRFKENFKKYEEVWIPKLHDIIEKDMREMSNRLFSLPYIEREEQTGTMTRNELREMVREIFLEEMKQFNLPELVEEKKDDSKPVLPSRNLNKRKLRYRKGAISRKSKTETKES